MKQWTKLFIRILILIIITFLILIVIENLLSFKRKGKNNYWSWEDENLVINYMIEKKYPSEKEKLFPLAINRSEQIPEKKKDETRILVVGDSFIFGYSSINMNETWWRQLNYKLKQKGYKNVTVYGAGRYFYNTKDELENILNNQDLIDTIKPDLIIMGYVHNDPEEHDEQGKNVIKDSWEVSDTMFYHLFPNTNDEIKDRLNNITNNYYILKFFGKYFGYRFDIRARIISEADSAKKYENSLKKVDQKLKQLNIPYFYYFTQCFDNKEIEKANDNIYRMMKKLSINVYYQPLHWDYLYKNYHLEFNGNIPNTFINPTDTHPSIVLTSYYADEVTKILQNNYSDLLGTKQKVDFPLNINDTMPYLEIKKQNQNIYEFVYPEKEIMRLQNSKFLFYPIQKNYIKLNLEYPKKISKIKISGDNIKNLDVYVNTIDEKVGFDINETRQIVTPCENIGNYVYKVNQKITSVNISADFINEHNRNLKVEFIEE